MSKRSELLDFHAHLLPCADHGSFGMHETQPQLELMAQNGVTAVVATPHFYPNSTTVEGFLERVEKSVSLLLREAKGQRPIIHLGAEVLYCDNLDAMEGLDRLCIRGTKVLLLELPAEAFGEEVFYTVKRLCATYTVVLAHIDRYIAKQASEIQWLLENGAWAQINGYSLHKGSMRRKLLPFLESGRVVALGSDIHGTDKKKYVQFVTADQKLGAYFEPIMNASFDLVKNAERI